MKKHEDHPKFTANNDEPTYECCGQRLGEFHRNDCTELAKFQMERDSNEPPYKCCGGDFNKPHPDTCPNIIKKKGIVQPTPEFLMKAFNLLEPCNTHSFEECQAYSRLANLAIELQAGVIWDDPRIEDPIFTQEREYHESGLSD